MCVLQQKSNESRYRRFHYACHCPDSNPGFILHNRPRRGCPLPGSWSMYDVPCQLDESDENAVLFEFSSSMLSILRFSCLCGLRRKPQHFFFKRRSKVSARFATALAIWAHFLVLVEGWQSVAVFNSMPSAPTSGNHTVNINWNWVGWHDLETKVYILYLHTLYFWDVYNVVPLPGFEPGLQGSWFLVCYTATQLATQLPQRHIQVVRSNKVAWKRLTASNSTPAMDFGTHECCFEVVLFWCFVLRLLFQSRHSHARSLASLPESKRSKYTGALPIRRQGRETMSLWLYDPFFVFPVSVCIVYWIEMN